MKQTEVVVKIEISKILPNPYQPRKNFDIKELRELAHSINLNGLLQPITIRYSKVKKGYYEVIAGERRLRACKGLKLKEIECIIKNYDDRSTMRLTTIENLQREDLNAIEEARAYQQLKTEYNITQNELANMVSKSRSKVTNAMRLLELPKNVIDMIETKEISGSFGRTLLGLKDSDLIIKWAFDENKRTLSVNQLEKEIKRYLSTKDNVAEMYNSAQKIKNNYFNGTIDKKNKKLNLKFNDEEMYSKLLDFIKKLEKQ